MVGLIYFCNYRSIELIGMVGCGTIRLVGLIGMIGFGKRMYTRFGILVYYVSLVGCRMIF